ncbi:MAG: HAMP domain-containing sensor histidine kinase [Candidatus Limnocylindria bacterium]
MSLRTKLAIATAAAVALSVALASVVILLAERAAVDDQLARALRDRAAEVSRQLSGPGIFPPGPPFRAPIFGAPAGYVQVVTAQGEVQYHYFGGEPFVQPSADAVEVAAGTRGSYFEDVFAEGSHVRVYTTPLEGGRALQVARPLDEFDQHLRQVAVILLVVTLGGVVLGAALGSVVARTGLAPVSRLTEAAERVARTRRPDERIAVSGGDELGRLGAAFNEMLRAIEISMATQRQLVIDVSHELRTPLTSLQANAEVLARSTALPDTERRELLEDVRAELRDLRALVDDVIELARDEESPAELEDVRLDLLVSRSVERARRHAGHLTFEARLAPCPVKGDPVQLERAVDNLLDNAVKWSPSGGLVEISLSESELIVRDHGPGIAPDVLPHVFDRFYRARSAAAMPGSGLGLSIVRKVVDRHGWTVSADNAPDGGARIRLLVTAS